MKADGVLYFTENQDHLFTAAGKTVSKKDNRVDKGNATSNEEDLIALPLCVGEVVDDLIIKRSVP